jgi:hypothetical protein
VRYSDEERAAVVAFFGVEPDDDEQLAAMLGSFAGQCTVLRVRWRALARSVPLIGRWLAR